VEISSVNISYVKYTRNGQQYIRPWHSIDYLQYLSDQEYQKELSEQEAKDTAWDVSIERAESTREAYFKQQENLPF
jgi:hypothetical protein